jgi:hypothetical protein
MHRPQERRRGDFLLDEVSEDNMSEADRTTISLAPQRPMFAIKIGGELRWRCSSMTGVRKVFADEQCWDATVIDERDGSEVRIEPPAPQSKRLPYREDE